jgi:hypothetical protein
MRISFRHPLIGSLACAAVVLAVPATAMAATPSSTPSGTSTSAGGGQALAAIQAKAATAISDRLTSLGSAIPSVTANQVITSADRATLLATLNHDVSGLTALRATIAADTTAKQAASDAATIYTSYRVYALALPQVRYAEAADDLTGGVLPKLTDAQAKLAALLAGADSAKNTPPVQAAMTDLASKITTANSLLAGTSSTVLAFTPAQYDANHALLSAPRQNLVTAGADVKAARADITTVLGALK